MYYLIDIITSYYFLSPCDGANVGLIFFLVVDILDGSRKGSRKGSRFVFLYMRVRLNPLNCIGSLGKGSRSRMFLGRFLYDVNCSTIFFF